ncbi:MAG TPA: acyl-CoA carboxylase subunit epsilon, partial [Kocuria sp.]|nr:acyl-CoA carboxylase subunit epsilon [Kocuria sp.]
MTPTQAAGSPRNDARSTPHGAPTANHGASVSDPRTAAVAALPE